jgi:membrane protein
VLRQNWLAAACVRLKPHCRPHQEIARPAGLTAEVIDEVAKTATNTVASAQVRNPCAVSRKETSSVRRPIRFVRRRPARYPPSADANHCTMMSHTATRAVKVAAGGFDADHGGANETLTDPSDQSGHWNLFALPLCPCNHPAKGALSFALLPNFVSGDALMGTTARLEDLKRHLARLEGNWISLRDDRGTEPGRGREAKHPGQIPSRGWMDVLRRSWGEIGEANLFLIAGGVTYALILALFPGLAALVSLYGLALNPAQIEKQIGALSGLLPAETQQLLNQQLHSLVEASGGALGFGAVVGILLALWSASRGMTGLITALNVAYEEKERRGFFKLNLIALGLTLGVLVGGILVILLIGVLPAAAQFLAIGSRTKWLLFLVQWPLLLVLMMFWLAVLFRYAPDRGKPQWRWVSPGAMVATILWIIASIGFTVYVANFNSYDKTYGSLGGVVVLLTWLYLSALVVLFGAVINAQSEKQTREDSTDGPPRPMGQRDARAADALGASQH